MATPPSAVAAAAAPKFADLTDLAAEKVIFLSFDISFDGKVGGKILFSTDDWFAAAHNMLRVLAHVALSHSAGWRG